jgi:hypothetical protein
MLFSAAERLPYEAMYRLCIEQYGLDIDFDIGAGDKETDCWGSFPTRDCLEVLIQNQPMPASTRPIQDRLDLAKMVDLYGSFFEPSDFFRLTGLGDADPRLETMRYADGSSVLHYIGNRICKRCSRRSEDADSGTTRQWMKLGVSVLKACLNPHHESNDDMNKAARGHNSIS